MKADYPKVLISPRHVHTQPVGAVGFPSCPQSWDMAHTAGCWCSAC